ncbi:MAG: YidB family protein [Cyanobium sp.]
MALLDDLSGGVVAAVAGDKAPALNDFIKSNGGLSGLADKFQNGGAGELFASWVGTGDNKAITTQQINAVLGSSQVQEFAKKLGIDPDAASTFIATNLPALIDKITPDGKVEPNPDAQAPTA